MPYQTTICKATNLQYFKTTKLQYSKQPNYNFQTTNMQVFYNLVVLYISCDFDFNAESFPLFKSAIMPDFILKKNIFINQYLY